MTFFKFILLLISFFLYSSLSAQFKDRLEFGLNMGDFRHQIKHEDQIYNSSKINDVLFISIELYSNWYLKDKKTFLSIRYLIDYNGVIRHQENSLNNSKQKTYEDYQGISGFYFGAGRDLFNKKKHKFQTLISLGYFLNDNRYIYQETFVDNELKSIYEFDSPPQHQFTFELQLKYKYYFYKGMYVSVGANNTLSYHVENGTYINSNKQYENGFLVNNNETKNDRKSSSFNLNTWNGFIGLGYNL